MGEKIYLLCEEISHYSERYNKWVYLPMGYPSDGATGAPDLRGPIRCTKRGLPYLASLFWWVHDRLCDTGMWACETRCTNWQIAMVAKDILKDEGHKLKDFWYFLAMFLFGGGKARDNGMIYLKHVKGEKA